MSGVREPAGRGEVRVKVCGVRSVADAELAAALGASWIGCVLAPESPRCASLAEVAAIDTALAGRVPLVLVFRGDDPSSVLAASAATGVRRVQVHGASAGCLVRLEQSGLVCHRVWSVPVEARELPRLEPAPSIGSPALLDVGQGGTGRRFRWSLLAPRAPHATLIAGGITPDNVGELLAVRPFGIDVSSGVESAPGVKDRARLEALFAAVAAGN